MGFFDSSVKFRVSGPNDEQSKRPVMDESPPPLIVERLVKQPERDGSILIYLIFFDS